MANAIDLKGQRFNRLIVIERDYNKKDKSRQAWWKCKCDCGKEISVRGQCLRNGNTQSCGCYGTEKRNEAIRKSEKVFAHCKEMAQLNKKDMLGYQIGKLTVIEATDLNKKGSAIWKCKCECGNITYVTQNCLHKGDSKSCGCIKSFGEEQITKILINNNIKFEREKQFNDCILPSGKLARFDFYVNNQYIIEFDGKQHFVENDFFQQSLEEIQEYDKIKNQWCFNNKIKIIRIPYTHLENMCLEDLLLETSNYILKEV
jgi:hypothetical protein